MLESRSYYRTALYLSIINALINTLVWNHLVVYSQGDPLLSSHSLIFYVIFLAIAFGQPCGTAFSVPSGWYSGPGHFFGL